MRQLPFLEGRVTPKNPITFRQFLRVVVGVTYRQVVHSVRRPLRRLWKGGVRRGSYGARS
jgi:hypothetical protein